MSVANWHGSKQKHGLQTPQSDKSKHNKQKLGKNNGVAPFGLGGATPATDPFSFFHQSPCSIGRFPPLVLESSLRRHWADPLSKHGLPPYKISLVPWLGGSLLRLGTSHPHIALGLSWCFEKRVLNGAKQKRLSTFKGKRPLDCLNLVLHQQGPGNQNLTTNTI